MSNATPAYPNNAAAQPSLIDQCFQCTATVPYERFRLARHAIPCGHVVCGDCCAKIAAQRRSPEL